MQTALEFTNRLLDLHRQERFAMADFIVTLAEFDRRELWRDLGHASLFAYLMRGLKLSGGAASYRKTACELVRRFPLVEAALRDGRLYLSSVVELAKVVTSENADEVIPRFFQLSSREAALVAASIRPVKDAARRDVVTVVRPVVVAAPPPEAYPLPGRDEAAPLLALRAPEVTVAAPAQAAARVVALPAPREIEPIDAREARVHFNVQLPVLEKVKAAKDALSHSHPAASLAVLFEVGLDLIVERQAKRRGLVKNPRKAKPRPDGAPDNGVFPAEVRRAAFLRAGSRCEWRLPSGEVCGSTHQLELDHVTPWALGGPSTLENARVLCGGHNELSARLVFGDAWMDQFKKRRVADDR